MSLDSRRARIERRNETWVCKLRPGMLRVPRKKGAPAVGSIPPEDARKTQQGRHWWRTHMNRHDEIAVMHVWNAWLRGRVIDDETYLEFFDEQIRGKPQFGGLHVFEVLDVLLNAAEPDQRESA
jgi:hypothetical protein